MQLCKRECSTVYESETPILFFSLFCGHKLLERFLHRVLNALKAGFLGAIDVGIEVLTGIEGEPATQTLEMWPSKRCWWKEIHFCI